MENGKNTYFYSLIMFLIMALIESILKRDKTPSLLVVILASLVRLFRRSHQMFLSNFLGFGSSVLSLQSILSVLPSRYQPCCSCVPVWIETQSLYGLPSACSLDTAGSLPGSQRHHAATCATVDRLAHSYPSSREHFQRLSFCTVPAASQPFEQSLSSVDRQASDCSCLGTSRYLHTPRHQRNLLSTLSVFQSIRSCFPQRKSPFATPARVSQRGRFDCISDLLACPSKSVNRDYTTKLEQVC
jgi:hypothetical protein